MIHASIDFIFRRGTLFEIAYCVQSKYSTHCVKLKHEVILVRVQKDNQRSQKKKYKQNMKSKTTYTVQTTNS